MHLPRHSTVAAYAALFVALGGTSYAAIKLPANSVGSREIRNSSVQRTDLAKTARPPSRARIASVVSDTMTSQDVLSALSAAVQGQPGAKGDTGPTGPAGPQGAPGVAQIVVREAVSADVTANHDGVARALCQPGERVLGGGGRFTAAGQAGAIMTSTLPTDSPDQGWGVTYTNNGPATGQVHAFAVCGVLGS
jgi:hypothetical protein